MDPDFATIAEMLTTNSLAKLRVLSTISREQCQDGTIPFGVLHEFIWCADQDPSAELCFDLRRSPERRAVVDVINNTVLKRFLIADVDQGVIRFRDEVPDSVRISLAEYVRARTHVWPRLDS